MMIFGQGFECRIAAAESDGLSESIHLLRRLAPRTMSVNFDSLCLSTASPCIQCPSNRETVIVLSRRRLFWEPSERVVDYPSASEHEPAVPIPANSPKKFGHTLKVLSGLRPAVA